MVGSGRKSWIFAWKVLPLLDVRNVGRLVDLENGSLEDCATDSGLAEREAARGGLGEIHEMPASQIDLE